MAAETETLTSYVLDDEWVCIFCAHHNALASLHCAHCGLSFKGGVPSAEAPRPSLLVTAASPAIEFAMAVGLLACWKLGDIASGTQTHGAVERGRNIWRVERSLGLPDEGAAQRLALPSHALVHALDGYYAVAHLGGMVALACWLYGRHRARYARWRTAVIAATFVSFLVQLISVAPPRLVPGIGVVDTAARNGESVYGHAQLANQVSSMPSVHMVWAIIVAAAVCAVGRTRRRWLAVAHPIVTLAAIVLTGNHYWLDALAAAGIAVLAICLTRPGTDT